jgi:DNA mismatch endonuclease (patch repair protein)
MRSNRSIGTTPEVILSRLLGKPLHRNNLPGRPDFVYPKARLAVFVHGDWWHRCPECAIPLPKAHRSYWEKKLNRNVERDKIVKRELEQIGWRVLEIWEHEVREDPKAAADRIRRRLLTRLTWATFDGPLPNGLLD